MLSSGEIRLDRTRFEALSPLVGEGGEMDHPSVDLLPSREEDIVDGVSDRGFVYPKVLGNSDLVAEVHRGKSAGAVGKKLDAAVAFDKERASDTLDSLYLEFRKDLKGEVDFDMELVATIVFDPESGKVSRTYVQVSAVPKRLALKLQNSIKRHVSITPFRDGGSEEKNTLVYHFRFGPTEDLRRTRSYLAAAQTLWGRGKREEAKIYLSRAEALIPESGSDEGLRASLQDVRRLMSDSSPASAGTSRPLREHFKTTEGVLGYLKGVADKEGYQTAGKEGERLGIGMMHVIHSEFFKPMRIPEDLVLLIEGYAISQPGIRNPEALGEIASNVGLVSKERVSDLVTFALGVGLIEKDPRATLANAEKRKGLKAFVEASGMNLETVQAFRAEWLRRWETRDKRK